MLLSLLVPTLDSRRGLFQQLQQELARQVHAGGWHSDVEILHFADDGERSIGQKRNELIDRASGRFLAFIDDDDQVSGDYIARICETILHNPAVDCIGIRGIITFRGGHPREFTHSLRYGGYRSRGHIYFRPPYHLNPIRREIAVGYRFADVSYSEDIDWAMRMGNDGALKSEAFIDSILYYYRSRRFWRYQWLLDNTEGFRHKLGIRLANRLPAQIAMQQLANRVSGRWSRKIDAAN